MSSLIFRQSTRACVELQHHSSTSSSDHNGVCRPLPPGLSTAMSTLTTSAPHQPTIDPRRCTLAPQRKHAKEFLTLPNELLTNIADYVSPKDLPNFRLTCKTLANIAAKQFGQKRLAHRRFIFTKYSLQGLIDMTGHSVFGPCIKSIMFGTDRLTNELQDLLGSLKKHKITDHTKAMHVLQTYHERWIKHSAFLEYSDLSRVLVTALRISRLSGSMSLLASSTMIENSATTMKF